MDGETRARIRFPAVDLVVVVVVDGTRKTAVGVPEIVLRDVETAAIPALLLLRSVSVVVPRVLTTAVVMSEVVAVIAIADAMTRALRALRAALVLRLEEQALAPLDLKVRPDLSKLLNSNSRYSNSNSLVLHRCCLI